MYRIKIKNNVYLYTLFRHQIGFFRDLYLNRNQLDNQNQPGNQNQRGNQNHPGNPNQPGNQNQPADAGNQPSEQGNQPQPQPEQPEDARSLWSVTWMIFTTFFASLIPDADNQWF